ELTEAPPIVHQARRSPGQPLDNASRAYFEPRFGRDFSEVRVHTDGDAALTAFGLGAAAYTVETHIVFASGRYQPQTSAGRRLLAHELAHVLQSTERRESGADTETNADRVAGGGAVRAPAACRPRAYGTGVADATAARSVRS